MTRQTEIVEIRPACLMCPEPISAERACKGPCSPHPTRFFLTREAARAQPIGARAAPVPPCSSERVAQAAGRMYGEVLAGTFSLTASWNAAIESFCGDLSGYGEEREAIDTAIRMVEARTRRPLAGLVDAAEAALAMAEDALADECATSPAGENAFAALAAIADLLRAALAPVRAEADAPSLPTTGVSP